MLHGIGIQRRPQRRRERGASMDNKARHWLPAGLLLAVCSGLALVGSAATVPAAAGSQARPQTLEARYGGQAARHIYDSFRLLVHPGRLPGQLQAVVTLETHIDADGAVQKVDVVAASADRPQITPWIVMLVQASQPFPPAPQGRVVYRDTWRITADGRFQLDAAGALPVPRTAVAEP
jgi:protein TonB